MLFKDDVKVSISLQPEILKALPTIAKVYERHGQELVVTCGLEGRHKPGSKHYKGLAIDTRNRDFDPVDRPRIAQELRDELGPDYDVVEERTHFHIEFDPDN